MNIRFLDEVFPWSYAYLLESELLKRRVLQVGPQEGAGITVHSTLAADWEGLAQRLGPIGPAQAMSFPFFIKFLAESPLSAMLDHELQSAVVNLDLMGTQHPSPLRPGKIVVLLFLSSRWPQENGGEVFFYSDESRKHIVKATSPSFNRAVVFDGAIPYAVRPPTKAAVYPKLSATFVLEKGPASNDLLDPKGTP
ncbi:MAG TPA: 2OG-Fe(II) oxygenase [Kofleriaceae bacterium]|nr:2OG-Fe(II) oxygenase [Kofleriaceae bacterium]